MKKYMNSVRNEKGIALAMVLVLSLIALMIVSAVLYMSTQGARLSGGEKFFKTADEAALGGARLATDLPSINFDSAVAGAALTAPFGTTALGTQLFNNACLTQKLSLPTSGWTGTCTANMRSLDINNADPTTFDMRFSLPGTPIDLNGDGDTLDAGEDGSWNVYAKIIDTIEGNTSGGGGGSGGGVGGGTSGSGGGLSTGGVGSGGASVVTPPRISWLYRIDVQAQSAALNREQSRYTVLYAR